jgi:hypothetical protein
LYEKLGYDDNLIIIIKFAVVGGVDGDGGVVEEALVLVAIEMAFKKSSNQFSSCVDTVLTSSISTLLDLWNAK